MPHKTNFELTKTGLLGLFKMDLKNTEDENTIEIILLGVNLVPRHQYGLSCNLRNETK